MVEAESHGVGNFKGDKMRRLIPNSIRDLLGHPVSIINVRE
jgi:hypothetical protein